MSNYTTQAFQVEIEALSNGELAEKAKALVSSLSITGGWNTQVILPAKKDATALVMLEVIKRLEELPEEDQEIEIDAAMAICSENGVSTIRTDNLADKMKLEAFVTQELYPNYNDRDKYNLA